MVVTALITPMKEDTTIDWQSVQKILTIQLRSKASGIVLLGTTAETPTLTLQEQDQIIHKALEIDSQLNQSKQIWVGVSSNSTAKVQSRIQSLNKLPLGGYLISSPWYNKPNQEGIYQHFMACDKASSKPIMVYNVPGRSGVKIEPQTFARIFENSQNVSYLKDAGGEVAQTMQFVFKTQQKTNKNNSQACILSGDDALTLPFMSVGARGVVSVISNLYPDQMADLVNLYISKEPVKAQGLHYQLLEEMNQCFIDTNPIPIKHKLFSKGLISSSQVRLPLTKMTN